MFRNLEVLLNIWEFAEEKLTVEEINNKLLLGTDNRGKTAWHLAAEEGNLNYYIIFGSGLKRN